MQRDVIDLRPAPPARPPRAAAPRVGEKADLLIGVNAIAEFLGYSRHAAQHLIDAGHVPVFRIGSRIHSRRSTLNAWLDECEAKAREEATKARKEAARGERR